LRTSLNKQLTCLLYDDSSKHLTYFIKPTCWIKIHYSTEFEIDLYTIGSKFLYVQYLLKFVIDSKLKWKISFWSKGSFIGFWFDHLYHNIARVNSYNTMYESKKRLKINFEYVKYSYLILF